MIKLYKPKLNELWYRKALLIDFDTMSFNHAYGGTIEFSESDWRDWYSYWVEGNDRFYRYIVNEAGEFVGEAAYHLDCETNRCIISIIISAKFRNQGYGSEALDKLCSEAKERGISEVYDDIAIDNPSINLFLKHGFIEVDRNTEIVLLKKVL